MLCTFNQRGFLEKQNIMRKNNDDHDDENNNDDDDDDDDDNGGSVEVGQEPPEAVA